MLVDDVDAAAAAVVRRRRALDRATIRADGGRPVRRDRMVDDYVTVYEQTVAARERRDLNAGR